MQNYIKLIFLFQLDDFLFLIQHETMINTLNESHLHKTLKDLYALNNEGAQTEVRIGTSIADIAASNKKIFEIQTGSLGSLKQKCLEYIKQGYTVTVVYPLACTKYIETTDLHGNKKRRKSPVKKNLISVFRELTSLTKILLSKNFYLDIIQCQICEERIEMMEPVQSQNHRRHFKKTWLKTGKKLEEMGKIITLHGKSSYKKMIPKNLGENFTTRNFYENLKTDFPEARKNESDIMVWVLWNLGLIERIGKKGNSYFYSLKKSPKKKNL